MPVSREQVNRAEQQNAAGHHPNTHAQSGSEVEQAVAFKSGHERDPKALTPDRILALQRSVGNQAVLRMLAKSGQKPAAQPPTSAAALTVQRDVTLEKQHEAGIKSFGDASKLPPELRGPVQYGFTQPSGTKADEMMKAGTKSFGDASALPHGMRGKVGYDAPVRHQAS